jgi:hypothetical protein
LITNADIATTRSGSLRRAVLEWFQAVQFQDVASLRRLTAPAALAGVSDATLASWLSVFGAGFPRPRITNVLINGTAASVRMLLLSYKPPSRTPSTAQPFTLMLDRVGGSWLVNDIVLLRASARAAHLAK